MSDCIRHSKHWDSALQWMLAEAERLGWVASKVKEDMETKTTEGKLFMVKSQTLREDGIVDFIFYVEPVHTFQIRGPDCDSDVSAHVLRGKKWFRVYHENSIDLYPTYPLRNVMTLANPENIKKYGFGARSYRTGYILDWWVHFLKREAEEFPLDTKRLQIIRELINVHER